MHYAALVDNNASELSAAIGAKVRSERQAREWTLDQLAEHSGVSRRMLINVEQGTANPSVTTLLRLSDALGIGLQALVAVPQTKPVKVIRDGEAPALWTGEGGGRGVLLAGTAPPDILELWDWTLAPRRPARQRGPRARHQGDPAGPRGHGHRRPSATRARSSRSTTPSRSPATSPHSYANEGTEPARFSLTVFEPGVGAGAKSEASHD